MLLLIIQIALTLTAFRNGWKLLALIPIFCGLGITFVIGFVSGLNGTSDSIWVYELSVNLVVIAILTILNYVKGPMVANPVKAKVPGSTS